MPRLPNSVVFACEHCGRSLTTNRRIWTQLFPWKRKLRVNPDGTCRHCNGETWKLTLVYVQTGNDLSPGEHLGLNLLRAFTGINLVKTSTAKNRSEYPNIPASTIAWLDEVPAQRMLRVSLFATELERERLKQAGGLECTKCGTLFVPGPGKPWAEKGYCSKLCWAQVDGALAVATADPIATSSKVISARCVQGHEFEVARTFAGMVRPCPVCGSKTPVG